MIVHRLAVLAVALIGPAGVGSAPAVEAPVGRVALSKLDSSAVTTSFILLVDVPGATSAKLVVDGQYIGEDAQPPLEFSMGLVPGSHKLRVRSDTNVGEVRSDAEFTATGLASTMPTMPLPNVPTVPAPVTSTTVPLPLPPKSPAPIPPAPVLVPRAGDIVVDTVAEIRAALSSAKPGDVIVVADGEYTFKPRLVASASGTADAPITLRGTRKAIIRTKDSSGDYGLHVTGDHWRVEGLTVAHASKGIVLDGSVGTVIDGVEVFDVGAEAVHFRTCSSDGVLRNSYLHDTGRSSPQYGEGVYVGSANSNWSGFQCTDRSEGKATGDNTERVLIEDNVFEDITAEGADLKEGTDSGTLRRNVFRRAGTSGMNSADSAVDAKGNNWLIEDNTVSETSAPWDDDGVSRPSEFEDGFQTHSVYAGYGTGNVFRGNTVVGAIPGFGVGMYPRLANVVMCDNSAPGAAKGLVGVSSKPATCSA